MSIEGSLLSGQVYVNVAVVDAMVPNRQQTINDHHVDRIVSSDPIGDPSSMMTSSNGYIFNVTGPLCGKFTGHRWILLSKASDAEL